jgi:hypothetical protein
LSPKKLQEWLSWDPGEPIFLYYGKFTRGKCLGEILSAFSIFRNASGSGRLLFIGGEIGGGIGIHDSIKKLNLGNKILVHPFVPNWLLPSIIKKCAAALYLKNSYLAAHHISIVPREIVACGTPLITTLEALSGSPQLDKCSVHLVPRPVDPVKVASAMNTAKRARRKTVDYKHTNLHLVYVTSWEKCILSAIAPR